MDIVLEESVIVIDPIVPFGVSTNTLRAVHIAERGAVLRRAQAQQEVGKTLERHGAARYRRICERKPVHLNVAAHAHVMPAANPGNLIAYLIGLRVRPLLIIEGAA